uniref:T-complex protein 1 subunit delta n=1 Tax=Lygus hesperus TaxID=30085 RepID=A0A0A9YHP0_LYGHE
MKVINTTPKQGVFSGREKEKDVRYNNIVAAKAIADIVRTSLGPKGMDKLITSADGQHTITNDGATIVGKLETNHPAAKMIIDLSKAQDIEAGDGTTSVVILAGSLLDAAQQLIEKGIHASSISRAFMMSLKVTKEILTSIAIPLDFTNRDSLLQAAITSLNSKVISTYSDVLAPIAVDAVLRVVNPATATNVDLQQIKVVSKVGGTIDDTELIDGLCFAQGSVSSTTTNDTTSIIKNAKIGLIQYQLSPPKTNMENSIVIEDYTQIDRILREERTYIQKLLKPIIKSGCNVLLIQKSILRDAVCDLALHYLSSRKIMVIKDIERTEVDFIAQSLNLQPVADPGLFSPDKLGYADLVTEVGTPSGKLTKITGVMNAGKTVSILCRGSNRMVVDEAVRSLHDALCVIRSLIKCRYLIAGGGAPEIAASVKLLDLADTLMDIDGHCVTEYAKALQIIPVTLAENAGLDPIYIMTELRKQHATGNSTYGINIKKGIVDDMKQLNVLQPLLVSLSALSLATETCCMILKIDDIVGVR